MKRNDPLLYINSPTCNVDDKGLQKIFDSRFNVSKNEENIIDTISKIYKTKEITLEIRTKNVKYEGILIDLNKEKIKIKARDNNVVILRDEITSVNLIKIK